MSQWERRTNGEGNESQEAYAAFLDYLLMGSVRSNGKVASKCHKALSLINRWSARYAWVARASAYDSAMAQAVIDAHVKAAAGSEIERYRKRARDQAASLGSIVAHGLRIIAAKMPQLTEADLAADKLAPLLRALAACSQAGLDAEAQAIGVTDLLGVLDDGSNGKDQSAAADPETVE